MRPLRSSPRRWSPCAAEPAGDRRARPGRGVDSTPGRPVLPAASSHAPQVPAGLPARRRYRPFVAESRFRSRCGPVRNRESMVREDRRLPRLPRRRSTGHRPGRPSLPFIPPEVSGSSVTETRADAQIPLGVQGNPRGEPSTAQARSAEDVTTSRSPERADRASRPCRLRGRPGPGPAGGGFRHPASAGPRLARPPPAQRS